jgi:rhamnose utilization protein RhaD (predicted bifunctional aldolase and dehydrogenase)
MSAASFQPSLDHLLHISHAIGCNERLAQAGGGNTSVKTPDGRVMLVKASGTPLSRMSCERGWVAVNLTATRELLVRASLRTLSDAEREERVLRLLHDAVIEPQDARPSVETPLHALLGRAVTHAHPVAVVALGCRPDAERVMTDLCEGATERPPLCLPYIKPGSTLAFAVSDHIGRYTAEHGGAPDVVVQRNHGLFVAAESATACVVKMHEIVERTESWLLEHLPPAIEPHIAAGVKTAVRRAYGADLVILFSRRPELVAAVRDGRADVLCSPLSPDHVVYAGPGALMVEQGNGERRLDDALDSYRRTNGMLPKLIVIAGATVCVVAESLKKAEAAEAMAVAAVQAGALMCDTPRFLSPEDVEFVVNWEAEHYRAKQ